MRAQMLAHLIDSCSAAKRAAFLTYASPLSAVNAINALSGEQHTICSEISLVSLLSGFEVDGMPLVVNFANHR